MTTVSGFAGEIMGCIGETGIPTGMAVIWVNCGLNWLNAQLGTSHYVSGGYNMPSMTSAESGILFDKVVCDRYKTLTYQALSYGNDVYVVDFEEQGSMRRVKKTELAKEAREIWKMCCEKLDKLIQWHLSEDFQPKQTLYNYRRTVPEPLNPDYGMACPSDLSNWYNPYFFSID